MLNLPEPKLGDVSAITITSPDLEKSFLYYKRLGFSELFRGDFPFPFIQISDGVLMMMIRQDKNPYLALTYYVRKIDETVAELETNGIVFSRKPGKDEMIKRFIFSSPDNLTISLVSFVDGFTQPAGPSMLTMPQEDYFKPEKYVNKACGLFGELAHPVKDLQTSIAFWEKLGFKTLSKRESPYPWAIVSDGLNIVGLHQTNHFDYPAITFFASDMKEKISKLISEGLTDKNEIEGKRNITLTSPEGQHVNLFSFGM
jgi:catechol 2,3-dioxygenase-like lactoylglutathione lyase family enzyme